MTTYCEKWNAVLSGPIAPLSEAEAGARHRARQPYTVVVREQPLVLVEMCFFKIYCHVRFFDERKRKWLVYSFEETADARLFLRQTTVYLYDGQSQRPSSSEVLMFKPDGSVVEDIASGGAMTRRELHADVSSNYEGIPDFGHYDSLVRVERTAG